MVSQLLYGEHFKILESRKKWSKIRTAYDSFEGWVANNQITIISEEDYRQLCNAEFPQISSDVISHICTQDGFLIPILLGSSVNATSWLQHNFEGSSISGAKERGYLVNTAFMYLKAPFLAPFLVWLFF